MAITRGMEAMCRENSLFLATPIAENGRLPRSIRTCVSDQLPGSTTKPIKKWLSENRGKKSGVQKVFNRKTSRFCCTERLDNFNQCVYIYIFGNILFGWNRGYLIFLIIVKDFLKISFHIFWGDKRKRLVWDVSKIIGSLYIYITFVRLTIYRSVRW